MAPTRSKKRKSTDSASSIDIQSFPAPPQIVPTKTRSPASTPTNRSPIKKAKRGPGLAQKQALIDNLQLEITERARKLRAQYMLQAQGLRTRIEIRVNRIPMALRRAKMGDLVLKYNETSKPATGPSLINSPRKNLIQAGQSNSHASPSPQRGMKRLSDAISIDKENEDIENPKKRTRALPNPPARTTSKPATTAIHPNQVLSPRSANSQTLSRSPIRPNTPAKSLLTRPISPLKPAAPIPKGGAAGILTNMIDKTKASARPTRKAVAEPTAATKGKRTTAAAPAPRTGRVAASIVSEASDSSTSTSATAVRKPVAGGRGKGMLGAIKGMGMGGGKKATAAAAASKMAPPATAASGRTLRKRN